MTNRGYEHANLWERCVGAWSPTEQMFPCSALQDYSDRHNHGTMTTMDVASDWITKQSAYGLDFDGTNDHVILGFNGLGVLSQAAASNQASFSISAFVATTASGTIRTIYCEGNTGATPQHLDLRIGTTNVAQCFIRDDSSSNITLTSSGAAINDGNWHHIVVTKFGSAANLFCDGVIVATSASFPAGLYTMNAATIGANRRTTTTNFFSGQIGEVRVYTRNLSNIEIDTLRSRQGIAFDQSRRRSRKAGAAGGGFNAAWMSQRSHMIGGGIR